MTVTGIDACRTGWVAVTLAPSGMTVTVAKTLDELDPGAHGGVTGIDMPLGLLADGWRTADVLARRALGPRGATVFAIPPRPVWAAGSYAEANALCKALTGRGLSAQAWGLRSRLLEADRFRRGSPHPLHEVHPELSFAELAGAPLAISKHTPEGLALRRSVLAGAGIVVPARVAGARADDLLDATAVAWSASRIAAGSARVLADPAQRADDGAAIAIWC